MNTAVAGIGLGLAVPINAATNSVIGALTSEGRVRRAYLGIAGAPRPIPPPLRDRYGAQPLVEVIEVLPATPAALAGLQEGDLLVALDGHRLEGIADVQTLMSRELIGVPVEATTLRAGIEHSFTIVPVELAS